MRTLGRAKFFHTAIGASALIIILSLLGKLLGLWRELETARLFGVGPSVDAFIAAWTLVFFAGRMTSDSFLVSVPRWVTRHIQQDEQDAAWGNLFRALILIGFVLTAIAALVLPWLVPLIFGGLEKESQRLVVQLVFWMLPLVSGWTLVGSLGGVLNAQHRYGGYQVAMLLANVGVLAVLWSVARRAGITALAWGWSAGIWIGVGLLALLLRTKLRRLWQWRGWRAQWQVIRALMGGAGGLFVWFVLTQMPIWIDRYFTVQLSPGSLSALGYAQRLFQLPLEMVTAVVMSVWVTKVAKMPTNQIGSRTFKLMGRMALVTFPMAGALVLLAQPIVTLVYARGAFDAQAVTVTSGPFVMYSLGLGFHTLSAVLVRTFQARGLSRYPIFAAILDITLTGCLDVWVIAQGWGTTGIAGVNTLVAAVRVGILSAFLYMNVKRQEPSPPSLETQ